MKPLTFQTNIGRLDYLNTCYVEIPADIVQKTGGKMKLRVKCTINKRITFSSGFAALGEGRAYVCINSKRMKELGVEVGDQVHVSLVPDNSKYGMEMSQELAEVLKQDREGDKRFHKLPPGKQRYIIYYVGQVKSSHLRIERALKLIGNLKNLPPGNESFRDILGVVK